MNLKQTVQVEEKKAPQAVGIHVRNTTPICYDYANIIPWLLSLLDVLPSPTQMMMTMEMKVTSGLSKQETYIKY